MSSQKKEIPSIDHFQERFSRVPKILIFAFVSACIVFVIVHAGYFDDRMVNEDFRHYIHSNWQNFPSGRFFCFSLITSSCNSWTLGVGTCLYFALSTVLLVDMFRVRTKIGAVLSAFLVVGMPALSYMFSYMFSAPLYGRLYFLAVLAVWTADRWRWGFIPATAIFSVSLGVGQSALIAGTALCVLALLRDLIMEEQFSYKALLLKLAKFLVMGVVGVALYFLLWKFLLKVTGLAARNYKGMDQLGSFTIPQMVNAIKQSYIDFVAFFFGNRFFYVSQLRKVVNALFFALFVFALVFTCIKHPGRIFGVLAALLLFPPAIGCIQIFVPQVSTDVLMIYPIGFLLILGVIMAETVLPFSSVGRVAAWLMMLVVFVICLNNYDITSAYYVKAETYEEHTMAYENRLLTRIERTPGYYVGIPVAIICDDYGNDYIGMDASDFPHVLNDRGYQYSYVGSKGSVMKKTLGLIEAYTGVTLQGATAEQVRQVRDSAEYAEMTSFPLEDSIRVIDGILTVNFMSYELKIMQVDDNTILLDFFSHVPADDGKYAWYVYDENKKLQQLTNYQNTPWHLITLTEDREYVFKGSCAHGKDRKTLTSAAITVKDGVISADAGLRMIDLEELLNNALENVQVRVEKTSDQAVCLSATADNMLPSGLDATYAWHVYRDGEHLSKMDRSFGPELQYDLELPESGSYCFELLIQIGDRTESISVMSEETEIRQDLSVLRAGENTVYLEYLGLLTEKEGIRYAWNVYKDGQMASDLGRSYQSSPAYLLTLEEDGTYKFKCVCLVDGEKTSIMSFPVVIEKGVIKDDSRLGEISLAEAERRIKPEVEIQVTLVGNRAVKLSMIDNSLGAGAEYTYAWQVYQVGEQLKELKEYKRPYTSDPEYDLILAEDGVYRFRLFYRIGDSTNAIMSGDITIGEAQSAEDAA